MSRSNHLLPELFKEYLTRQEEEDESIFSHGFTAPMQGSKSLREDSEVIAWKDVEAFLRMTQESLRVREERLEQLEERLQEKSKQLEREQRERSQVARLEASASEDSSFLATEVEALMQEKVRLKDKVQQLERENQFLAEENQLLRRQVEVDAGEEAAGGSAQLQEELRLEQQCSLVVENEVMQLRARVAALERANKAQHTAMLSCIEESERVRLQHEQSTCRRLQRLHICGSPVATADWALQLTSGSTRTDDSADFDYDSTSHASCLTPRGECSSDGGVGGHGRLRPEPPASPSVLIVPKPPAQWQQQQ